MANRYSYIDGNTARKLDMNTAPVIKREAEEEVRRQQKRQKKTQKRLAFDLKYTLVLVVAIVCAFVACVDMLAMQSALQKQERSIDALTTQYENMKKDNDAMSASLDSKVDLNAIYKTATKELGMVYPTEGQVITYEGAKGQYVKQYQDVPDLDE